ncbi:MAG: ABC transporter ATP-binding protein [Chloroflexi bacterium]|nr:ABC transporter ATP-binding protein [Chloroflexota bacterium]
MRGVTKAYETAAGSFTALNNIDLQIETGKFAAIVGKSGSGKSTLLNMLTGIDRPTTGEVEINGTAVTTLTEDQIVTWRGRNIGVVFQFFQLMPTLTVIENVMMPMDFCNVYPPRERRERALALLEQVGVANQADKFPAKLSGGQQQRVAIARALANDPPTLVADEPTGNLDSCTADDVLTLFQKLAGSGKTVIMVTHERDVESWVSRVVTLVDGEIVTNEQDSQMNDSAIRNHTKGGRLCLTHAGAKHSATCGSTKPARFLLSWQSALGLWAHRGIRRRRLSLRRDGLMRMCS